MAAKKGLLSLEKKKKEFVLKALIDPLFRMQVLRKTLGSSRQDCQDNDIQEHGLPIEAVQDLESQINAIADDLLFACIGPRGTA